LCNADAWVHDLTVSRRKFGRVITGPLTGLVLACALGALAGLTVGVPAGVLAALAGFVPSVADLIFRRRTDAGRRAEEMNRLLTEFRTPSPALPFHTPKRLDNVYEREIALLLRPENRIVRFWQRPELNALLEFCQAGNPVGISLVTGGGGSGKTRLALQLCELLLHEGWVPLWVRPGAEYKAVGAAIMSGQPCVLVVDYAEARDALVQLIQDVVSAPTGTTIRVVLLARSLGKWWEDLISSPGLDIRRFLDEASLVTLRPLTSGELTQTIFDNALAAFARRLQVPTPEAKLSLAESNTVFLVVHAAALLVVLDEAAEGASREPRSVSDILDGILQHEAGYWTANARKRGLNLDHEVFRLVLALQSLVGAADQAEIGDLLALIPDLADSSERRWQAARWLNDVYPAGSATIDASGQESGAWPFPDVLSDHLMVGELGTHPDLVRSIFERINEEQALRAFRVLVRAANTQAGALSIVKIAFTANPEALGKAILLVAPEINSVIIHKLQGVLFATDYSIGSHAGSGGPSARRHAIERGTRDAVAAVDEGIQIQRRLATGQLDTVLQDLAATLTNQARSFANAKRWSEASAALGEAINIYRLLSSGQPDGLLPGLGPTEDLSPE
jgi:hypothetical protein